MQRLANQHKANANEGAVCADSAEANAKDERTLSRSLGPNAQGETKAYSRNRGVFRCLSGLTMVGALFAVASSPASAFTGHSLSGAPFGAGSAGELSNPLGVAVDNSKGPSVGDVYVADNGNGRVLKFSPTGTFISEITGLTGPQYVAVDPTNGDLYVSESDNSVAKFNSDGSLITSFGVAGRIHNSGGEQYEFGPTGLAVDPLTNNLFTANAGTGSLDEYEANGTHVARRAAQTTKWPRVNRHRWHRKHICCRPSGGDALEFTPSDTYSEGTVIDSHPAQAVAVDPSDNDVYIANESPQGVYIEEYDSTADSVTQFGQNDLGNSFGLAVNGSNHAVYAVDNSNSVVAVFTPIGPEITTGSATEVTSTSVTLVGNIGSSTGGAITKCEFDYGTDNTYGHAVPCSPGPPLSGGVTVTADLPNLVPGITYHDRLVATNAEGTSDGQDSTVMTPQAPAIASVYSTELTETTAALHARINPNGFATTYQIEYGPTASYGSVTPVPDASIGDGTNAEAVVVHLTDLLPKTVYHFRVVAQNEWGTTTSEDQSFNFFPENCPNAAIRQETGSEYLPDCRAYELVSPAESGNVVIFPGDAPAAPHADNAFAFSAALGAITGTDPPDNNPETYVATRTNTGWHTTFPGLKGDETLTSGNLVSNQDLSRTIDFEELGFLNRRPVRHTLPFLWDAGSGESLGQWPSGVVGTIPGADSSQGAYQPSPDFSHLAFSSAEVVFAPGGLASAPGSAYDYDNSTGSITVISKQPSGAPFPAGPGNVTPEFVNFPGTARSGEGPAVAYPTQDHPAVSTDGSHILMSMEGTPPNVFLYMRVDDDVTYDVSQGHAVKYVGMTPDGAKVFFTSSEQLVPEDTDTSIDLYMWSESGEKEGHPITLVSDGSSGAGNSDSCEVSWIAKCDVLPVVGWKGTESEYPTKTDNSISENGDIYFYSPQQLDGAKGIQNGQNLYDYRNGEDQFVATFTPHIPCSPLVEQHGQCSNGPVGRIQVSPDDSHVAFLTTSKLTGYNNLAVNGICSSTIRLNGKVRVLSGPECLEMYSYTPSNGKIVCVSCDPNGAPPLGDANASAQGLFMSNDGRIFFETPDPLVAQDTDNLNDIYEYVDGRPQLITTGTGALGASFVKGNNRQASLEGVTADGENVFFSSYNTLVSQDQNGNFAKFYDARTDGGFPYVPPSAPCAAADECHGLGSSPPSPIENGTGFDLGSGGNHSPKTGKKRKRRLSHKRQKHYGRDRRARRANLGSAVFPTHLELHSSGGERK